MFEIYKNLNNNSNVHSFEIFDDGIRVIFKGSLDKIYVYTTKSTSDEDIMKMKSCARKGYGLNSYIMRNCKKDYSEIIDIKHTIDKQ